MQRILTLSLAVAMIAAAADAKQCKDAGGKVVACHNSAQQTSTVSGGARAGVENPTTIGAKNGVENPTTVGGSHGVENPTTHGASQPHG